MTAFEGYVECQDVMNEVGLLEQQQLFGLPEITKPQHTNILHIN